MTMSKSQGEVLIELQRAHFDRAAALDRRQLQLQVISSVLALAVLFVPAGMWEVVALLAMAVSVASAFGILVRSRHHRSLAEKTRRATLLVDGIGMRLSPQEMLRLAVQGGMSEAELDAWKDPGFFASRKARGVPRAAEMLFESAFWTVNLLRASADRLRNLLILFGVGLAMCFLLSLGWMGERHLSGGLRVFCALTSSLVWFEFLGRWILYRDAITGIDDVMSRIERLEKANYADSEDFYLAMVDYNSSVEAAPMVLHGIYDANKDRLNKLWKDRNG
jgi:hypothetical protein